MWQYAKYLAEGERKQDVKETRKQRLMEIHKMIHGLQTMQSVQMSQTV